MPTAIAAIPTMPAIAGVTACGKTDIAIELAKQLNGEIISVDSASVYKDLNIGTATPTLQNQSQVPHHLINIIEPNESYNVQRFIQDTVVAVNDIQKRGKTPLLVGGTMMYFDILLHGISTIPAVSKSTLQKIQQLHQDKGLAYLYDYLKKVDIESAKCIAFTDKQRICRALSVYEETKKPLSYWTKERELPAITINLVRLLPKNRDIMRKRIFARLHKMWEDGLLEETEAACQKWSLNEKSPAMRMIGYKQALAHLNGVIDSETMKKNAFFATSQFAKRQYTWLNRWSKPVKFDPLEDKVEKIFSYFEKN